MRELTAKDVVFKVQCDPEEDQIEGNCSAVDEETDEIAKEWILDQLDKGNTWAWCCVTVEAHWKGYVGTAMIGQCSYEDETQFTEGGYYDDMKIIALHDLNEQLARLEADLAELNGGNQ